MNVLITTHNWDADNSLALLAERLGGRAFYTTGPGWGGYTRGPFRNPRIGRMTVDEFRAGKADLVIGTSQHNREALVKIASEVGVPYVHSPERFREWELFYDMGVRYILNMSGDDPGKLISARYHPEIEWADPSQKKVPRSVVSCQARIHELSAARFTEVKDALGPDWTAKEYGTDGRDGGIPSCEEVQKTLNKTAFLLHHKPAGDSYGFVFHRAMAAGCPVILPYRIFESKRSRTALSKCIDGVTSFNSEAPVEDIVRWMNQVADNYEEHSLEVQRVYKEHCDYDREFHENLEPLIQRAISEQ